MTVFDDLFETLNGPAILEGPPTWYQAFGEPPDNGVLAIDENMEHLIGWTAPEECWGIAVVAPCTIYETETQKDGGDWVRPIEKPGRRGNWVCSLLARDGRCAGRIHRPDGTTMNLPGSGEGFTMDAMKRALGMATSPPQHSSAALVARIWLGSIGDMLDGEPDRRVTWADVVALHPVAEAVREFGADFDDPPRDISELLALSDVWSWEYLHRRAIELSTLAPAIDSDLARWMDVGMFSRWVLAGLPPAPTLLAEVRGRLPSNVRRRLNSAVCHLLAMPEGSAA